MGGSTHTVLQWRVFVLSIALLSFANVHKSAADASLQDDTARKMAELRAQLAETNQKITQMDSGNQPNRDQESNPGRPVPIASGDSGSGSSARSPQPAAPPPSLADTNSNGGITHLNYSNNQGHTFIIHNVNTINGFGPEVEKKRKEREQFDNKSELDETQRELKELLMSQEELKRQLRQEKTALKQAEKNTNGPSGVDAGKAPTNVTLTEAAIQLRRPWYNWGGDYADAGVVVERGVCYLHGLVRGNGGMIGTLPDICRPVQGRLIFSVMKGGSPSRVDILNDGRIYHVAAGQTGWLSLNGIAFALKIGPSIRLVNDWQKFGGSYREPSLWIKDGLCMASGIVRGGKWGNFVLLPEECIPMQRLVFSTNNHENIIRMDVLTAEMGAFIARAGGYARHGWAAFDGMAWSQNGGQDIETNSPWKNYGGAYQPLRYERIGRICLVSGLVTSSDWNNHITRLPEDCRPDKRLVFGGNVHMSSARVDVLPDGRIYYLNGKLDWDWLSMSGIKFVVKQPKQATAASAAQDTGGAMVDAPEKPQSGPNSKVNQAVEYVKKKNMGKLKSPTDKITPPPYAMPK